MKEHNLSIPEWRILVTLASTTIDRPSAIAEFTSIEVSTLSRTLDRLEKQNFVKRTKLPESGRAYAISLTKPGIRALKKAEEIMWEQHDDLLRHLNKNEGAALLRVVKQLYVAIGRPPELADKRSGHTSEIA
jgi:DNA-binding MarR family transcriptional regulator